MGDGLKDSRERREEEISIEAAGQSVGEAWNSVEKAAHVEAQAHATYPI